MTCRRLYRPNSVLFMILFLAMTLSCSRNVRPTRVDVDDYQYDFTQTEYQEKHEGSLWAEENAHSVLFMDYKARRVNDIITVSVVENDRASGEATTNTKKKSGISAKLTGFFGSPLDFGLDNLWGGGNGFSPTIGAETDNTFDGSGKTARKGSLVASITARVIKVLPNGILVIRGRKEVTINNEEQIVNISGLVRPKDISADNTVLSIHIADARIEYTGKGVLSDRQSPGWFARGLDLVWPF